MKKLVLLIFAAGLLLSGCRSADEKALRRLDAAILLKDRYERNLEQHATLFRDNLKRARTDSLAFASAEMLFNTYRHFSLDSSARYLSVMEQHAVTKDLKARTASAREDLFSEPSSAPGGKRTIAELADSAEVELKAARKDCITLYELALLLYEEKDYARADRYIERNFLDAMEGRFNISFFNSGKAYQKISKARRNLERRRTILLLGSGLILIILAIMTFNLLRQSRRQKKEIMTLQGSHFKTVSRLREDLADADAKIHDDGKALSEANRIKEQLLFRVMELSAESLSSGSRKKAEPFYRAFDEAFLNAFPDFIDGVNGLLKEEARFEKTLPFRTELRILAVIRLGMTESGKIAEFLGMAPPTVYSYRTRMRNASSGPKDLFEERIRKI